VTPADRAGFLLEYIDLLQNERVREPEGVRHSAPVRHGAEGPFGPGPQPPAASHQRPATSHDRWVINKIRALGSWYTKGLDNGSHLRTAINGTESIGALRDLIAAFFGELAPVKTCGVRQNA
jgi:hypothetical protein